jgi:hypothetical protein
MIALCADVKVDRARGQIVVVEDAMRRIAMVDVVVEDAEVEVAA